jgi:uncharacterized membrane protein
MSSLLCPCARAELNFCNSAPLTIDTAVGESVGGQWRTRGWYSIKPGECATVVGGNLTSTFYYGYAETPGAKWVWSGSQPMCATSAAFTIVHPRCGADDLKKFVKIDNGAAQSFNYWFTCAECPGVTNAIQPYIPYLEQVANQAVIQAWRTSDWVDIGPVDIQYGFTRSPFRLTINGNQISVAVRIAYWLSVSHVIPILGRNGLASCGVDEAQPEADITLTTIFGVAENGRLASKTRITNLSFPTRCNLTMFNIDATGYIQNAIQPQLDGLTAAIDSRISQLDVSRFVNVGALY